MKSLETYIKHTICEGKKVSPKEAIDMLKSLSDAASPIKVGSKDMTTGYVRKGDHIQFCNSNFVAMCDCQYSDIESKALDYDSIVFQVFVKDNKGVPTLMELVLEDGDGEWWPADGWIEDEPSKELEKLAKSAGLKLHWNGEHIEVE